ncbi:MAG: hypothetical protein B7733_11845 [Myxococcales bacterium FL481]|nr:MAG: hypothetical protein B7733_11845 [Myxococcales bacterium FL481]
MGRRHRVLAGDTLASIAREYGFRDWARIWAHPDNADLRAKRRSPDLLTPGDEVFVPFREPTWRTYTPNAVHTFVLAEQRRTLHLVLLRPDGSPHAGCRYVLQVGQEQFEAHVPTSGNIVHELATDNDAGTLEIWLHPGTERPATFELKIGHLVGVEEPLGRQARLANLGFYRGPLDGVEDTEDSRTAARAFARRHDVEPTDHTALWVRLEEVHGC